MGIDRELAKQVWHMMRPYVARVQNVIARGVVKLVVDSEGMQRLQVLANLDEVIEGVGGVEHFQPYGFFSIPFADSEAIVVFPTAGRDHPVAVVVADRRYRPKNGAPGECGLRTDEGDELRLGRGHVMILQSNTVKLGSSSAAGDVVVQAALTGAQGFMAALDSAITSVGSPANASLVGLKAALIALNAGAGWKAGTTKTKAE